MAPRAPLQGSRIDAAVVAWKRPRRRPLASNPDILAPAPVPRPTMPPRDERIGSGARGVRAARIAANRPQAACGRNEPCLLLRSPTRRAGEGDEDGARRTDRD